MPHSFTKVLGKLNKTPKQPSEENTTEKDSLKELILEAIKLYQGDKKHKVSAVRLEDIVAITEIIRDDEDQTPREKIIQIEAYFQDPKYHLGQQSHLETCVRAAIFLWHDLERQKQVPEEGNITSKAAVINAYDALKSQKKTITDVDEAFYQAVVKNSDSTGITIPNDISKDFSVKITKANETPEKGEFFTKEYQHTLKKYLLFGIQEYLDKKSNPSAKRLENVEALRNIINAPNKSDNDLIDEVGICMMLITDLQINKAISLTQIKSC